MIYFRRLDSLRFFAFFLVFWSHGYSPIFDIDISNKFLQSILKAFIYTGDDGVHIFFVISGFLITLLLIKEYQILGGINIRNFYIRRILRIWPLYYLVMILGIFILPNIFHTFHFCGSIFKNLFFLNNLDINYKCESVNTQIAWSVAIEEQFYLIWPLILALLFKLSIFKKPYLVAYFCLFIYLISTIINLINPYSFYFNLIGCVNYLMMGCFGAFIFFYYKPLNRISLLKKQFYFICILIFTIFLTAFEQYNKLTIYLSFILYPILYLYFILFLVINDYNNSNNRISLLGKYTYGMYLFHPIILIFFRILFDLVSLDYQKNILISFACYTLALIITIFTSIVSYEKFEKHILNLKRKFANVQTRI